MFKRLIPLAALALIVTACGGAGPSVNPPPPNGAPSIKSFTTSLSTINLDQNADLTWDVANATSVTIQPDLGTVSPSGNASVSPDLPTTYTLTAKNASGDATKTLALEVNPFSTLRAKTVAGLGVSALEVGVSTALVLSIRVAPPDGQTVLSLTVTKGGSSVTLKDSGNQATDGDDAAGDQVYSGKLSLTESQPGTVTFEVSVVTSAKSYKNTLSLPAIALNADTLTNLDHIQAQTEAKFKSFPANTPTDQVLAQTKTDLDANATALKIQSTRVSDNVLEVIDSAGIHSFFQIGEKPSAAPGASQNLSPAQPTPASTAPSSTSAPISALQSQLQGPSNGLGIEPQSFSPDPDVVGNRKALIYAPVTPDLGSADVDAINSTLTNSKLKFDVTVLRDEKADILSLYRLTNYGFIYFTTHGTGGEWLQTGELATSGKDKLYQLDMQSGQIGRWEYFYGHTNSNSTVKTVSYAVSSKWFSTHLYGKFPNSFIYIGSCESLKVRNLSDVFRGMGAGAYFGYTNDVANNLAIKQSIDVTNALVKDLKTAGDTYSLVRDQVDPLSGTKPLVALGNQKLRFEAKNLAYPSWAIYIRSSEIIPGATSLVEYCNIPTGTYETNFFIEKGENRFICRDTNVNLYLGGTWAINTQNNTIQLHSVSPGELYLEGKFIDDFLIVGTAVYGNYRPKAQSWCAVSNDNGPREKVCNP